MDTRRKGQETDATKDMVRYAIMHGLRTSLRPYVMQQDPATPTELMSAAKVAEATTDDSTQCMNTAILEAINHMEQRVAAPMTRHDDRLPVVRSSRCGRALCCKYFETSSVYVSCSYGLVHKL